MDVKEEKHLRGVSLPSSPLDSRTPPPPRQTRKKAEPVCPGSPEPNCAICLEKLQNRSVTDSCLHKFCFTCLLEWSKVKAECPLCKSKFASIIHNIRSDDDFEEYKVPRPIVNEATSEQLHPQRLMQELHMSLFGHGRLRFSLPTHPFAGPVATSWRRRRGGGGNGNVFRKSVYERDLWVDPQSLADITGRYRECSPDWFRNNPAQTHRLVPWLRRELSVLLESDAVSHVLNIVLELICSYDILSRDFQFNLSVHLGQRTAHFAYEFYHYARSVYDLVGYDRNALHSQRLPERISSSGGSEEVVFLDEVRPDENTPSTSGGETSQGKRPRLVVPVYSSDSSEEDNIQIIDVLPPRQDCPEVVMLTTDEEEGGANPPPSTTIVVSSDDTLDSYSSSKSPRRKRRLPPTSENSSSPSRRPLKRKKGKGPGKKSRKIVYAEDSPEPEADASSEDSSGGTTGSGAVSKPERRKKRKRKLRPKAEETSSSSSSSPSRLLPNKSSRS